MNKLIIANWKMQFTHSEALSWLNTHIPDLEIDLATAHNKLIICPSYTELPILAARSTTHISWGAQDCGAYERGAYTGDVSVLSLKELGCTYCLVGHSERRRHHGETDALIAQKVALLIKHGIEPVICVGESLEERNNGATLEVLERQLLSIRELMKKNGYTKISIAYEPVWSIGTEQVPRAHDISAIFSWIRSFTRKHVEQSTIVLLYGGSVNERTIKDLGLSMADGFLLGKASLEYEVLKKIILSC